MLATLSYRLAIGAAVPIASVWLRDGAVRQGHRGRLAAAARLEQWAALHRDPARRLAWFHAASVGEGLQARVVMAALRRLRPDLQVVATRFSASAERLAAAMPADLSEYLPYDRRHDVRRALAALRPDQLVFAKLDVWPELATHAAATGATVALIAGSVDPGSARLRWPARAVARRGYAALDLVAAIAPEDAERLVTLGAARDRIVVTGDPRVDAVLEAVAALRAHDAPTASDGAPDLLVAGSTWPRDEQVLLQALRDVRRRHRSARLLIVPHEPTTTRVATILEQAAAAGLAARRWDATDDAPPPVEVVDRLGVLVGLYRKGGVAYVGGGFGERGVHSVLEPAGWGRPVVIGPNDRGVRDARLLASVGGLTRLPATDPVGALVGRWSEWLDDPATAREAGQRGAEALEPDRGAARRSAELLARLGYP